MSADNETLRYDNNNLIRSETVSSFSELVEVSLDINTVTEKLEQGTANKLNPVRFQFLEAANIKTTIFWDTAPCRKVNRRFRCPYSFHHQVYESISTSETSVNFTRQHSAISQKTVISNVNLFLLKRAKLSRYDMTTLVAIA
jgi:hypothetical protein